jgi:P27 family predicted phage terminase small subunit
MPGPPPQPTNLRILRGNPSKRPLPQHEPQPIVPAEVPRPLDFLSDHAKAEWQRIAPELHALGLLSALDLAAFGSYCESYSKWRAAEELLAEMAQRDPATGALLIKGSDGPRINPVMKAARNAAADMVFFASHFGMSPAARARISAGIGYEPPPGKFDGLLA